MGLREISTSLSDILLALSAFVFAIRLQRSDISNQTRPIRFWWMVSLVSLGICAALGGVYHWFRVYLTEAALLWNWRLINVTIAAMSFSILWATLVTFSKIRRPRCLLVITLGLTLFLLLLALYSDRVIFLLLQYLLGLAVLLYFVASKRLETSMQCAFFSFIALSGVAALIQQTGVGIGDILNDNTLYHLIQIASLFFLERGVRRVLKRPMDSIETVG